MRHQIFCFVFLTTVLSACATSRGFDRGELRDQLNSAMVVNDAEIEKVLATKAQLPKPFKLGVYFKEPEQGGPRGSTPWFWTDEDKQKLVSVAEDLKRGNEVAEAFLISPAVVNGNDLKALRLAAAHHGADALLVVSGASQTDRYTNDLGWTYIALVPALFVPASETDVLFMSRAVMWDVRNQFLYLTAESESLGKQTRPAAFTDERKALSLAKTAAVEKLTSEISKRLLQISQSTLRNEAKKTAQAD